MQVFGRRLWSLWVGVWFFGYFIAMFPLYWVLLSAKTDATYRAVHSLNAAWAYFVFALSLLSWRIEKRGVIPRKGPVILVANHRSYFDIPLCYILSPRRFQYIGKAELAKAPLFGYMYRRMHIILNRTERSDRKRSLVRSADILEAGHALFIYPEGTTRHPSVQKLGEFYDGAFRLAVQTGAPLIPITLINTSLALSNDGRFLARPLVKLRAIIDKPIKTDNLTELDANVLKEQVRDIIQQNLNDYYGSERRID